MWVPSLDWEDPLEEGLATHSSILAWRIPWTEEADGLQSTGSPRVLSSGFLIFAYAVSPSNTLDQPGLVPGRWRPNRDLRRQYSKS